jgi:D-glycero-alpha-D-manno-heptose 1-phosphate guanylyltransferase
MTGDFLSRIPAFVLVGGLGTRLRSAYNEGPKAMAPIAGKPFLAYLLSMLEAVGFRRVILCVGYGSQQIQAWLGDGRDLGLEISYSHETQPMGTAGALRLAHTRYAEGQSFFAMNGDSIADLDFQALLEAHRRHATPATVALVRVPDASRYGSIELGDGDRVKAFREKSSAHEPGYINAGVYLFTPQVMDLVAEGRQVSLEQEILPALASSGLVAFRYDGYFIDIGIPEDWTRAQTELPELLPKWSAQEPK